MSTSSQHRRVTGWIATALVAGLALVGCSNTGHGGTPAQPQPALQEVEVLENPRDYVGPSTAVVQSTDIEPIADNPEQSLPTTVTSYQSNGKTEEIEITDTSRVVALDI